SALYGLLLLQLEETLCAQPARQTYSGNSAGQYVRRCGSKPRLLLIARSTSRLKGDLLRARAAIRQLSPAKHSHLWASFSHRAFRQKRESSFILFSTQLGRDVP